MSDVEFRNQDNSLPEEIDVHAVSSIIDGSEDFQLLDIREPLEVQAASINGSDWIPMREIPMRMNVLPRNKRIVIYCHHGQRSLGVARFLRQHGFDNAQSLSGGIHAWSNEIDPSVPSY